MAKSLRSKTVRRSKSEIRQNLYDAHVNARLDRISAKLHGLKSNFNFVKRSTSTIIQAIPEKKLNYGLSKKEINFK